MGIFFFFLNFSCAGSDGGGYRVVPLREANEGSRRAYGGDSAWRAQSAGSDSSGEIFTDFDAFFLFGSGFVFREFDRFAIGIIVFDDLDVDLDWGLSVSGFFYMISYGFTL